MQIEMIGVIYYFFSFIAHVLSPNGAYSGQKLMKLVSTNTPANTNNTIPKVPVITFVKYSVTTIAAITNLIILSAVPMFFFILLSFFN